MKDIIISANRQRKEIMIYAICFLCGVGINIYSIITFKTSWIELFSQIGWTVIISSIFYILTILVRGLFYIFRKK